MTTRSGPEWVLFDMNGTLLDPSTLSAHLPSPLDTESAALGLLDESIGQSMVDTLVGRPRRFGEYLAAATARRLRLAGMDATQELVDETVAAVRQMPAFDEVPAALDRLRDAGLRLGVITNSATAVAEDALLYAGIRDRFEGVVGSDVPGVFKPDPRVYRVGVERLGARPEQAFFVAAHGWDTHGARAVGLRTAWVSRKERILLDSYADPEVSGYDVDEVAQAILE
ncbi:haloacid dehalogenase type II [Allosaccharopolyspora coralli]|uniref:Haloacid dehalogenase type II n=1 Tax=Allosaccharopolyspora coralli TaxID=2665642 RepID=A0A5Q3Q5J2_9PSEU|nr:haloacid dehalogenase type II [Allosaccharopolyspora coralli]QGK69868.1 haloacid dehalogenase type II [Allosaccharopolyspora coralli]